MKNSKINDIVKKNDDVLVDDKKDEKIMEKIIRSIG
jgi:hypothetical protein